MIVKIKAVINKQMVDSGEKLSHIQLTYPENIKMPTSQNFKVKWNENNLKLSKIKKVSHNIIHLYLDDLTQNLHTFTFIESRFVNEFIPMAFEIKQLGTVELENGQIMMSDSFQFEVEIKELLLREAFKPYHFRSQMPYCLYNSGTGKQKPLVIFLHGSGERGNNHLLPLLCNDVPLTYLKYAKEVEDAVILIPQAPWDSQIGAWCFADVVATLTELIQYIMEIHQIDKSRVYLSGLSNGAAGTWNLMLEQPHLCAAAITVCGYIHTQRKSESKTIEGAVYTEMAQQQVEKIKQIPVWVFHGADDPVVSVLGARSVVAALRQAGSENVKYTEYQAGTVKPNAHASWEPAFNEKDLLPWLFSQKRHLV